MKIAFPGNFSTAAARALKHSGFSPEHPLVVPFQERLAWNNIQLFLGHLKHRAQGTKPS
jgi:hypothetical protein